ncbi:MAG TPA: hypothetical protein VMJ75_25290 [Candidatus Acidoferrales bacterium]|nr:hypothetical protein [Candidatus Acidoferrales bacterium]
MFRQIGAREDASPQRAALRAEVLKMVALLREAMGGGVETELAKQLRALNENRPQIEKAVVAWLRLIEVLVQEAERARRIGGGRRKKAQVKAALFRILNGRNARLPWIPRYLYPLVMDFAVEWSVEAIVQVENDYALWDARPEEDKWSPRADCVNWLKEAMGRVWQIPVEFLLTTYTTLKYREPLGPELEAAVTGVETGGIMADKNAALHSAIEFVKFLGQHGQQAIAGIKLVFEAVHMAESFLELDGNGKKQYAHDLIVATLEDLGFPVGTGLFGLIAGAFIDSAIEGAWTIFNERAPESFKHRRPLHASGAAPAGAS